MARPLEVYLDIETDWNRNLTVVGFTSSDSGTVQRVGEEITLGRLTRWLPRNGRMYTYNGHCFDLPCIRAQLGIDLRKTGWSPGTYVGSADGLGFRAAKR
jgi:hypothetical protein